MATKRAPAKRKTSTPDGILLRYRDRDTAYGVTRQTATRIAENLGLSETPGRACGPGKSRAPDVATV